jgi:hypothetical protein
VALLASLKKWDSTTERLMIAGIALALLAAWLDASFDAGRGGSPWAAGLVTIIPLAYIVRTLKFWRFVNPLEPNGLRLPRPRRLPLPHAGRKPQPSLPDPSGWSQRSNTLVRRGTST